MGVERAQWSTPELSIITLLTGRLHTGQDVRSVDESAADPGGICVGTGRRAGSLHPPGSPLHQVLEAWPYYLAYLVSFLTIGGGWLAHTALTDRLARADTILLRLNLLLLLVVGFLPFPTRLVAEALHDVNGERVFVTMYGLTLLSIRILWFALAEYARREHLYASREVEEPEQSWRSVLGALVSDAAAILIGLAFPTLAVALYFGIAISFVLALREIRHLLFRRT